MVKIGVTERLNYLNELYQKINREIDNDTFYLFENIKDYLEKRLHAKNYYVALYDEFRHEYSLPYYHDTEEPDKSFELADLKKGLTNYVIQQRVACLLDEKKIQKLIDDKKIELFGKKAKIWLGAPIIVADVIIGLIAVQDYEHEKAFDNDDLKILESISTLISFVFEIKNKISKEKAVNKLSSDLIKASNNISKQIELRDKSYEILSIFKGIANYNKATIQIIQKGYRIILAFDGFSYEQIDEKLLCDINKDKLIKTILTGKNIFYIPNVYKEPLFNKTHITTFDVKSWVCIPIFKGSQPVAIITMDYEKENHFTEAGFKDKLKEYSKSIEEFIIAAYEFENEQRKNRDLEISKLLVQMSIEQQDLKDNVFNMMKEFVKKGEYSNCSIFFPQYDDYQLKLLPFLAAGDGWDSILTRKFAIDKEGNNGLAVKVFSSGKRIITNKPEANFLPPRHKYEILPGIAVYPITLTKRIIGAFCIYNKQNKKFTKNDLLLINPFIKELENVFLINLGRDFSKNMSIRIIKEEEDEILKLIVSSALLISNFTSGTIRLIEKRGDCLKLLKSFEYPLHLNLPDPKLEDPSGLTRNVIEKGETLVIPDTDDSREIISTELKNFAKTMIIVPLKIGSEIVGVISIYSRMKIKIDKYIVPLLETLCNQAAAGIMKTRMLNELKIRNKQLEVFKEIGNYVLENTTSHVFRTIYEKIKPIIDTNNFFISIYDKNTNEIETPLWIMDDEYITVSKKQLSGLSKIIVESNKYLLIKNYDIEEANLPERATIITKRQKSWLGVPIFFNKEIIGIISVQHNEPNKFDENTKMILENIASQIAFVVNNVKIFNAVQNNLEIKEEILKRTKETLESVLFQIELLDENQHPDIKNKLKIRIQSSLAAYEYLILNPGKNTINMKTYFYSLIKFIVKTYNKNKKITVWKKIDNINLPIERAIACGQILNELIVNSFIHAFNNKEKGKIVIRFGFTKNNYELIVSDNGDGVDRNLCNQESITFGNALVRIQTDDKLKGQYLINITKGFEVTITFPHESEIHLL